MKQGDLVEKFAGDWGVGQIGTVLKVSTNGVGTALVTVFVGNEIKTWSMNFVKVISRCQKDGR